MKITANEWCKMNPWLDIWIYDKKISKYRSLNRKEYYIAAIKRQPFFKAENCKKRK